MRRSPEPRVASRGEILFDAGAGRTRAQLVNLSPGGACARGIVPGGGRDEATLVGVTVALADGAPPLAARARVAWVAPAPTEHARASEEQTFGLCFTDLGPAEREWLSAHVEKPDAAARSAPTRMIRLRIDGGPALRAEAEELDEQGVVLGAELPWLRLGASVQADLDGTALAGRIAWVGLDVAPSGAARLRLRITSGGAEQKRRDTTLPYFSTEAPAAPLEEHIGYDELAHDALVGGATDEAPIAPPARAASGLDRLISLVRLGERRRLRLGVLRAAVGLLALSAIGLGISAMQVPAVSAPSAPIVAPVVAPTDEPAATEAPIEESGTDAPPSLEVVPAVDPVPQGAPARSQPKPKRHRARHGRG